MKNLKQTTKSNFQSLLKKLSSYFSYDDVKRLLEKEKIKITNSTLKSYLHSFTKDKLIFDAGQPLNYPYGCSATNGTSVYLYVHWWHKNSIFIADCDMNFSSGNILGTNIEVKIYSKGKHIILTNLPQNPPDPYCTVIKLKLKNK